MAHSKANQAELHRRFVEKQTSKGESVFVPNPSAETHQAIMRSGKIYSAEAHQFNSIRDFSAWARSMVMREETGLALQHILSDDKHPHFMTAFRLMLEYGFGRPSVVVEVSAKEQR